MTLQLIDWLLIGGYGVLAVALGSLFFKKATQSVESFFVGSRKLPWWIAGTSIVATTFAADTPLAVTGLVAVGGIAANWLWWAWAIAHVVSTFLFARLWRRSGVITDAEITEMRYSGRPAAALRGFKAIYFGVFINCLTMAWVIAAMVKISRAFFPDYAPWMVIAVCVGVAVLYTTLGGFRSVVLTDLVQFTLGMLGAVILSVIVVNHHGGVTGDVSLVAQLQPAVEAAGKELSNVIEFVPSRGHPSVPIAFFIVMLIAGWWRWAEGNGYLVQRLAACKDEGHAQGASLWFAIAHNALRPWPWILVALGSMILYPAIGGDNDKEALLSTDGAITVQPTILDVATGGTLQIAGLTEGTVYILDQEAQIENAAGKYVAKFDPFETRGGFLTSIYISSGGEPRKIDGLRMELADREMGYALMMREFLPPGLLGLVIASLLAAFMSTIDTHTNWGASYLVRDVYQRFIDPDASEQTCVRVSRASIVLMGILAGVSALFIQNIAAVWQFIVTLGAGLGSVTAARWYWSRVTPQAEFAAIGVTTVLAIGFQLFSDIPGWVQIVTIAAASLATWIPVALLGPANNPETLRTFAERVRPGGPGWTSVTGTVGEDMRPMLVKVAGGIVIVYASLFGIGRLLFGETGLGLALVALAAVLLYMIIRDKNE